MSSRIMKYLEVAVLFLVGLLFFVWPMEHTITLRGVLLILCLVTSATIALRRENCGERLRELCRSFSLCILFTLWIIFQAVFVSAETSWAMKEIIGQWGNALAALCIGAALGICSEKNTVLDRKNIFLVLFIVLAVHIFCVDVDRILLVMKGGYNMRPGGLTAGPDKGNYLSVYLLLMVGTDIFFRAAYKKRLIAAGIFIMLFTVFITFYSLFFEAMRNGTIIVVLLLIFLLVLWIKETRYSIRKPIMVLFVFIAIFSFLFISVKADRRWKALRETIPIALDTQNNKAWLDSVKYPWPKLKNGETVDLSAYLRIAMFKEGTLLVMEHPLGIGFGRNAYGHGLAKKYNDGGGHSHSGILDIAIGTGIPGLLLWIGFLFYLTFVSFKRFKIHKSSSALLLFFVVATFGLRMCVDSIIRDHMLQQFMFFAGLLYILMINEKNETVKI